MREEAVNPLIRGGTTYKCAEGEIPIEHII